jgi:hypothetical protein
MRRDCPFNAGAHRPAGTGQGRAGIDGNPRDGSISVVCLVISPGGAAPDVDEPAFNEAVAEPRSG